MSVHIGWPQGIWLGLAVIRLILAAFIDGEPRTGKHKFAVDVVSVAISLSLLWWGGFFG